MSSFQFITYCLVIDEVEYTAPSTGLMWTEIESVPQSVCRHHAVALRLSSFNCILEYDSILPLFYRQLYIMLHNYKKHSLIMENTIIVTHKKQRRDT